MALLDISDVAPPFQRESIVSIPSYRINETPRYAVYTIVVCVNGVLWTVNRRYREFRRFDKERFPDRSKSFLPPKKLVGNMDKEFLNERRIELEKYIRSVVELDLWLAKRRRQYCLPMLIAKFLKFNIYEVHSICEDMSIGAANNVEKWLGSSVKYFEFNSLEMYAVTERLKLAEPTTSGNS
ncbi:hypothetical protein AB6A40_010970 [Gnathostoma spinigerum]|uniref:PX domain-containing protein n=1 Tax=Gnathostoma spinigerum TaxID=75299 RepID=A0ABD6EWI7_9BILA